MGFKFNLLISLITHFIILIFAPVEIKQERLKGEKITPIEIINNESFNSSSGNTNKNSLKNFPKKIQNEKKKLIKKENKIKVSNELKLNNKKEKFKGDFQVKKKEIKEITETKEKDKALIKENQIKKNMDNNPVIKEKQLEISQISNTQKKGFGNKETNKDVEKGSIQGIGKLKITCLNCISPKYPKKALRKGLEGKTTVKVWVLKSGIVEKTEIIISSGISSIDKAALDAAKKSIFHPLPFDSFLNIEYDLNL